MIQNENNGELRGQMDFGDLMGNPTTADAVPLPLKGEASPTTADAVPLPLKGEASPTTADESGMPEGYDSEGNLLNLDYPPLQPSPAGEGGPRSGSEEVSYPHTSAEAEVSGETVLTAAKAEVSGGTVLSDTPTGTGKGPDAFATGRESTGVSGEPSPSDTEAGLPETSSNANRLTALATEINAITEQTRGVVISAALAVGKRLIEAKSLCPEGRFGEWLARSVNYSERKAQDMMRLYVEYGRDGAIPESIAALDYSKAVALLSAPAEAREQLAERAAEEALSVRELNAEIKRLKAEVDRAQLRFDIADKENEEKDNLIRDYDKGIEKMHVELQTAQAAIEREREAARLAEAKAKSAEASADQLRRLHSDAEDRAAASAQRASDAVQRANQTAKDLSEARAKIAALEEAARAAAERNSPEVQTVEVVPEAITKELADLRARLAEARATQGPGTREQGTGEGGGVSATEKFKWFYANQMKPAFTTALDLLKDVAREDAHAADLFATALTRGCQQLMNQLGTKEG